LGTVAVATLVVGVTVLLSLKIGKKCSLPARKMLKPSNNRVARRMNTVIIAAK
jgi:hypothetical protein